MKASTPCGSLGPGLAIPGLWPTTSSKKEPFEASVDGNHVGSFSEGLKKRECFDSGPLGVGSLEAKWAPPPPNRPSTTCVTYNVMESQSWLWLFVCHSIKQSLRLSVWSCIYVVKNNAVEPSVPHSPSSSPRFPEPCQLCQRAWQWFTPPKRPLLPTTPPKAWRWDTKQSVFSDVGHRRGNRMALNLRDCSGPHRTIHDTVWSAQWKKHKLSQWLYRTYHT